MNYREAHAAGARVRFVDEGAGPPVVLVHGSPVSSWSFRAQIAALAPSHRVIAPDLLGFGGSEGPKAGASFLRQARVLAALLDQLALGPMVLGGHDWGGPIAYGAAAELAPGRVRALMLINTTLRGDFRPPAYWRPFVGRALGAALVVGLNLTRWMLPTLLRAPSEVRRVYTEALADRRTRAAVLALERMEGYAALLSRASARSDLRALPTLIAWGHPDPYFRPPECQRLAELFVDPTVAELAGAGHFPQEEGAEALTAAMTRFLAQRLR